MSSQDRRDNLDADPAEPSLADLIARLRRRINIELRVAMPARVVTYNALTQRADVTLELLPVRYDEVTGAEVPEPPIAIPDVPVRFLASPVGYVSVGIVPGTTGHVIFMDRAIDAWLKAGVPVDPLLGRTHDLADAVFEPGLHADTAPLSPPPSVIGAVVHGAQVQLGANATSSVILGTEFLAALATYLGVAAGDPVSGAAATALMNLITAGTFHSQRVRVAP